MGVFLGTTFRNVKHIKLTSVNNSHCIFFAKKNKSSLLTENDNDRPFRCVPFLRLGFLWTCIHG